MFAKIDPDTFERCFVAWVAALAQSLPGAPVVAIDGKTLRRSADRANGAKATHIVSAYARATSLVLGQIRTADKSNEITAIATLLDMLALDGALVTIDAMGCQSSIAERIVDRGADYLLAVKENQPLLCEAIGDAFLDADKERAAARFGEPAEQHDDGHGRHERRRCWVCSNAELVKSLSGSWTGLKSVVVIESERTLGNSETTLDRHWYISSRAESAEFFLSARALVGGERAALGVGRGVPRGRMPGTRGGWGGEPLGAQAHGAEPAQAREDAQGWDRGEALPRRMG